MSIEWDPEKARLNVQKHGIRFADAEGVLFDPNAISVEDERAEGEQRFVALGMDSRGRLLVVVYTYRGETVRSISARTATKKERGAYESGI